MSSDCSAVPLGSARDLSEVLGKKCRFLSGGISPLHSIAPDFFNVSAMTVGSNGVLSARGQVAPLQYPGERFTCTPGSISLRVSHANTPDDRSCLVAVSEAVPGHRRPMAMHVFNHDGGLVHRLDMLESDDELILAAASAAQKSWNGNVRTFEQDNLGNRQSSNVVALMPQMVRGKNWKLLPIKDHLDHVIRDGGEQRYWRLKSLSASQVRRIDHRLLPNFLDFLSLHRRAFVRVFVRKSLAQAHHGSVHLIDVIDDVVMAYSKNSVLALDLKAIEAAFLVPYAAQSGRSFALETYDRNGDCLAMFLQDEEEVRIGQVDWNQLVLSLPTIA